MEGAGRDLANPPALFLVAGLLGEAGRGGGSLPVAVDWHEMITLAGDHLVLPAMAARLLEPDLARSLPPDIAGLAEAVVLLAAERDRAARAQLEELVAALNAAGIVPLLLKGAAYMAEGLHEASAPRLASDLDLLIGPDRIDEAAACLRRIGYGALEPGDGAGHHHLPALLRDGAPLAVELHRAPVAARCRRLLGTAGLRRDARAVRTGSGSRFLVPSPTHLALHSIVHAQLPHGLYWRGEIFLRDALDLLLLERRFGQAIDWAAIGRRMRRHGMGGALWFHAATAHALLGGPTPPVRPTWLGRRARRLWRRRLDDEVRRDRLLEAVELATSAPSALATPRGRAWLCRRLAGLLRRWPAAPREPAIPGGAPSPP
ncbi:nucleotidyltransferase family protein [Marinimicrococcus flavescens]|uniref:Nucleotidyltransferase family protein n=1 Tax=Marinimicrococcus flavescens TaxID=3031815 RepID=A0AAP3XSE5_9PROT|nr:nucleotidyltransferase family protein [Marinimicrococcus flavescens]